MGLYHVHPCSSSCFPAPQQAFVGEMGQKRRLVAASSYVFEKGRNFSKQALYSPDRGQQNEKSTAWSRARKQDPRSPAAGGH